MMPFLKYKILFLFLSTLTFAKNTTKWPMLVIDHVSQAIMPKNYRELRDLEKIDNNRCLDKTGIYNTLISGSGQFTETQFANMVKHLKKTNEKVVIVDLRQEGHLLINGNPMTMFSENFSDFQGYDAMKTMRFEYRMLRAVGARNIWRIYQINEKGHDGKLGKTTRVNLHIKSATTEQALAHDHDVEYIRFSVTDHKHPRPEIVDQFLLFVQLLPKDAWVHFHCRGGAGRTSTFMLMMDMIRNHRYMKRQDIFYRQRLMGSKNIDGYADPEKKYRFEKSILRRQFIHLFYDYLVDPKGYPTKLWSQWLQEKTLKKHLKMISQLKSKSVPAHNGCA